MKKFAQKLEKWIDVNIVWFLYNGRKKHRYFEYLKHKWGNDI
jgi:hypothetical protein